MLSLPTPGFAAAHALGGLLNFALMGLVGLGLLTALAAYSIEDNQDDPPMTYVWALGLDSFAALVAAH